MQVAAVCAAALSLIGLFLYTRKKHNKKAHSRTFSTQHMHIETHTHTRTHIQGTACYLWWSYRKAVPSSGSRARSSLGFCSSVCACCRRSKANARSHSHSHSHAHAAESDDREHTDGDVDSGLLDGQASADDGFRDRDRDADIRDHTHERSVSIASVGVGVGASASASAAEYETLSRGQKRFVSACHSIAGSHFCVVCQVVSVRVNTLQFLSGCCARAAMCGTAAFVLFARLNPFAELEWYVFFVLIPLARFCATSAHW